MPERSQLDERLAQARVEVLAGIAAPPLAAVGRRAVRRRRARTGAAGATLLAVLAAPLLLADGGYREPVAARPAVPKVTAEGLSVIASAQAPVDLPGMVSTAAFTGPEHGYVLTSCADGDGSCRPSMVGTEDGGTTWTDAGLPANLAPQEVLAFPAGAVAVRSGSTVLVREDGSAWRQLPGGPPGPVAAAAPGQLLRLDSGDCTGRLEVWDPARGLLGPLQRQPDLSVCWAAGTALADGSWWVGGRRGDQPMVAVSSDAGRTWRTTALGQPLPGGGVRTQVAALGTRLWVTVLGATRADGYDGSTNVLRAVYHSTDGGRTFTATRLTGLDERPPDPWYFTGDAVPLADGRLLVAGQERGWFVSSDDGATFHRVRGDLPPVASISRTVAGYIAHGGPQGQWGVYFSADGSTWRHLPVH